ncbi:MAG: hypothetical protein HWD60_02605 [Defluviicoccus sp.]|nr:MAG: hypothetical protein HWD60_02605 [Defluviicoccus sp.]
MQRRLVMPRSARGKLNQILDFEIERLAPIPANLAVYGYCAVDAPGLPGHVAIDVAVAERSAVSNRMARARNAGLEPNYAGPPLSDGTFPSPFNLLANARHGPVRRWQRIALAASGLLAAGIMAAVYTSLELLDEQIAVLESALVVARQQADVAVKLKDQVAALQARASSIETHRSAPSPLDALAEVTMRLPDDAWLVQFDFRRGQYESRGTLPRLHG